MPEQENQESLERSLRVPWGSLGARCGSLGCPWGSLPVPGGILGLSGSFSWVPGRSSVRGPWDPPWRLGGSLAVPGGSLGSSGGSSGRALEATKTHKVFLGCQGGSGGPLG